MTRTAPATRSPWGQATAEDHPRAGDRVRRLFDWYEASDWSLPLATAGQPCHRAPGLPPLMRLGYWALAARRGSGTTPRAIDGLPLRGLECFSVD
jgi:hypothetical protein